MPDNRLNYLFRKYFEKTASAAENDEFMRLLNDPASEKEITDLMEDAYITYTPTINPFPLGKREEMLKMILGNEADTGQIPSIKPYSKYLWLKFAAAACVLGFLSLGIFFALVKKPINQIANNPVKNDILPGGNKAVLTLANGSKIILTGAKNGQLAKQAGVVIKKAADGQIIYQASRGTSQDTVLTAYNTISTPRGGQYQVVLPDGSHVWLNAASSLKYPTTFAGNERKVELTGEAYFEVAKNKAKPFHVSSNGQDVEVLGTHFDINAYTDEKDMKTTLLEGSVKVRYKKSVVSIIPGEQAQIMLQAFNNQIVVNHDVDLDDAVAWKNGYFAFNHSAMEEVMRQLSRWYDVKVQYTGQTPLIKFSGAIQKDLKLSQVLNILQQSQVHFNVKGKEVIVMP